jgi:hypothetical protein
MPSTQPQAGSPAASCRNTVPAPALGLALLLALALSSGVASAQYQQPASPAPGGEGAVQSLDRARNAHAVGDNVTAVLSIWDSLETVWGMMREMGIRNAAFITDEPEFFGVYNPKQGQDFAPGELIILYCEPFGYTMRKEADGTYTNSLKWSFQILDQAGTPLGGQNDIGPYTHGGYRTFTTEKMLSLTINLSQFPAGSYTLSVTITDDFNPEKSVEIQKPFNILAGQ